jgi:hypothetical protein
VTVGKHAKGGRLRVDHRTELFACAEGDRVALCGPWTITGPRRPFRWTVSEINSGPFRWEGHILHGAEARRLADEMQAKRVSGGN